MENGKHPVHPTKANVPYEGLTKREYFAAMAMQGIFNKGDAYSFDPDKNCKRAVQYADALLKALEE